MDAPAPDGSLRAFEPTPDEVAAVAAQLASYYNDEYNRAMMAHAGDMTVEDVAEHFQALWAGGGRPFLLERDGALIGDADLRHVEAAAAEFAIMVGPRAAQGKGLGVRFAVMVHALAFRTLGLERIYVSIIPANRASLRLFEKLGYEVDESPQARSYVDAEDDVSLSISRERFEGMHADALAEIRIAERSTRGADGGQGLGAGARAGEGGLV